MGDLKGKHEIGYEGDQFMRDTKLALVVKLIGLNYPQGF